MCKECGCGNTGENQMRVLGVPGMMCEHCQNSVETALLQLPGVMSAVVDLNAKTVTVNYQQSQVTLDELVKAIEDTGFEVDPKTLEAPHHHHGIMHTITKFFK